MFPKKKKYHTHRSKRKKKEATCHPCPGNQKKKKETCPAQEKRKKKRTGYGYFCLLNSFIFSYQFSFYFREKNFWWVGRENTWTPSFIFLHFYPNKHTQKKFLSYFLSKVFYPPYYTSKQTHLKDVSGHHKHLLYVNPTKIMSWYWYILQGIWGKWRYLKQAKVIQLVNLDYYYFYWLKLTKI